jgi:G:T-mismatch repair DNA endonuclease (very short patch repair protein)
MLVEIGILKKATRLGAGFGSYSEFGSRTQTIWECNFNFTKEKALKRLERHSQD